MVSAINFADSSEPYLQLTLCKLFIAVINCTLLSLGTSTSTYAERTMAQILEICSMLGFTDRSSKGLPNALVDEVEQFIVTSSQQGWHTSTEDMTHGYLYDSEAGNRLWGRKSRSGYRPWLEWPRHGDRYVGRSSQPGYCSALTLSRIEGLLRQLFSVIVQRPPGTESFASPEEERPEQAQTPSIHAGSGDDSGSAAQFANKVHSGHTLKSQKSKRFSEMTNKSTRDDELISR